MKVRRLLTAAVAAVSMVSFAPAMAGAPGGTSNRGSATLTVTANVTNQCSVQSATLNFGSYISGQAVPVNASTTFNVMCSAGQQYQIGLTSGANPDASGNRRMNNGANLLAYFLTKDAAGLQPWDDTNNYQAETASGAQDPITVYGNIPANQVAAVGAYSDTVTINVYF